MKKTHTILYIILIFATTINLKLNLYKIKFIYARMRNKYIDYIININTNINIVSLLNLPN